MTTMVVAEAQSVDPDSAGTTGVAVVPARQLGLLRPIAPVAAIMQQQEEVRGLLTELLVEGRDYGVIPGTNKPALYKAGAERANMCFGVVPSFRIIEKEVDHYAEVPWRKVKKGYGDDPDIVTEGVSYGLYRYVVECILVHRESGQVVAQSMGSCSTLESKYCDRPRDCENTVLKMAEKRGYVGSTLLAYGLSDQFTQDTEDMPADVLGADAKGPLPTCPKCGGPMWDNRKGKRNAKAPDFKCRKKACEGVIWPGEWPPKAAEPAPEPVAAEPEPSAGDVRLPIPNHPETGKPLREIATDRLEYFMKGLKTLIAQHEQAGRDAAAPTTLLEQIGEVLADRAEEDEQRHPPQAAVGDATRGGSPSSRTSAGSSTRASGDGGPVDMPKPGAVGDALPPNGASELSVAELSRTLQALLSSGPMSRRVAEDIRRRQLQKPMNHRHLLGLIKEAEDAIAAAKRGTAADDDDDLPF